MLTYYESLLVKKFPIKFNGFSAGYKSTSVVSERWAALMRLIPIITNTCISYQWHIDLNRLLHHRNQLR